MSDDKTRIKSPPHEQPKENLRTESEENATESKRQEGEPEATPTVEPPTTIQLEHPIAEPVESKPPEAKAQKEKGETSVYRTDQQVKWLKNQTWVQGILSILTLGVLIFHGVIMTKQQGTMQDSADRQISAERAHLFFERITVHGVRGIAEGKPIDNESIFITYRMNNYGNTPAWINKIAFKVLITPDRNGLPEIPHYDNTTYTEQKYPILPDVAFDTFEPFAIQNYAVMVEQADDLLVGKQHLFVYGYIEYHDVFEQRHASHFAFYYRFNFYKDRTGDASDFPEPTGARAYWAYD